MRKKVFEITKDKFDKCQFNPDYPSTIDDAIKITNEQIIELKNPESEYIRGIASGLKVGRWVLEQLKKNMKKARK